MNENFTNLFISISSKFEYGEKLCGILQDECKNGMGAVICPDHLGDTFWIGSYMEEYKKQHGYNRVLLVTKPQYEDMLKLFPSVDQVLVLDEEKMDAMRFFFYLQRKKVVGDVRFGGFPFIVLFNYPGIVLHQTVNEGWKSITATWEAQLDLHKDSEISGIILPELRDEEILRDRYKNAVFLAPGAYSEEAVPVSFWEELTARFLQMGMEVYYNYNQQSCDMTIKRAKPLSTSIVGLAQLGGLFRLFVGLRSGICDLMAQTPQKMVVLFTLGKDKTTIEIEEGEMGHHDAWGMRKNGISCYQYLETHTSLLIDRIIGEADGACK